MNSKNQYKNFQFNTKKRKIVKIIFQVLSLFSQMKDSIKLLDYSYCYFLPTYSLHLPLTYLRGNTI